MDYSRPEIKKDCFAYNETYKPQCLALNALYCAFEHCSFYKTKEQEREDSRKAEMINNL